MQEITDIYIIERCQRKDGNFNRSSLTDEVKAYLDSRFDDIPKDMFTYAEVFMRIMLDIKERPVCPACGKPVLFTNRKKRPYQKYCSTKCACHANSDNMHDVWLNRSAEELNAIKDKRISTCIERYGCITNLMTEENKRKSKETCLSKYGFNTSFESPDVRDKWKRTVLEKYGVEHPQKNNAVRQKNSNTHLSETTKNKMETTCMHRYGVKYVSQLQSVKEKKGKSYSTKHTSRHETLFKEILETIFGPELEHIYSSEKYPYNCDFYIPSLDLYIEYNGSIHHYGCMFTDSKADNEELARIRNVSVFNGKNLYDLIYDTWCKRDTVKMNTAKSNQINYLVVYPFFHQEWLHTVNMSRQSKLFESRRKDIENFLRDLIYNTYENKTDVQKIIGEHHYGNTPKKD